MRVSLMSVDGVASVDVSLDHGLATVKLKPGNSVRFKQLQDAITKNGFTMKQSRVTAAGAVIQDKGAAKFRISGSNEVLSLVPESAGVPPPSSNSGATVVVEGRIPEVAKGKSPEVIRYAFLTEEKQK